MFFSSIYQDSFILTQKIKKKEIKFIKYWNGIEVSSIYNWVLYII